VNAPSAEDFAEALAALRRGGVVVFPTETFYGLAADALESAAVERVVALKGRTAGSPIAVIIADRAMLSEIAADVSPLAEKLIARFWPGPLTLVLPAKKNLPAPLLNVEGKIGVRVSSHPVATWLTHGLGRPITATSANPTGQEAARTVSEARKYFADRIDIYLDGGTLTAQNPSTVVEMIGDRLRILREGAIRSEALREVR
jgi:L-threonylcarbamoyladenylate synthase